MVLATWTRLLKDSGLRLCLTCSNRLVGVSVHGLFRSEFSPSELSTCSTNALFGSATVSSGMSTNAATLSVPLLKTTRTYYKGFLPEGFNLRLLAAAQSTMSLFRDIFNPCLTKNASTGFPNMQGGCNILLGQICPSISLSFKITAHENSPFLGTLSMRLLVSPKLYPVSSQVAFTMASRKCSSMSRSCGSVARNHAARADSLLIRKVPRIRSRAGLGWAGSSQMKPLI